MTLFTTENRQRNGAGLSYTFHSQHDGLFTEQPWRVVLEIEQQKDQSSPPHRVSTRPAREEETSRFRPMTAYVTI
jgi:hypothetical protein